MVTSGWVVREQPEIDLKLSLFLDAVFAIMERYALSWLDGLYDSMEPPVEALTDYIVWFWRDHLATVEQRAFLG
jgi:hypothetical protein